jgi:hypothetical protein
MVKWLAAFGKNTKISQTTKQAKTQNKTNMHTIARIYASSSLCQAPLGDKERYSVE